MGMQKKLRRKLKSEEKEKQKDFEDRRSKFQKELKESSLKHGVDAMSIIRATPEGIYPIIVFVDVQEKYEKEAKAKEEAEGSKTKLEL